jgi:hypothetical protein
MNTPHWFYLNFIVLIKYFIVFLQNTLAFGLKLMPNLCKMKLRMQYLERHFSLYVYTVINTVSKADENFGPIINNGNGGENQSQICDLSKAMG